MNPKTAISILLVITSLSVLTVLMILTNNGFQNKSIVVELKDNNSQESTQNSVVKEPEIQKDYSSYDYPDVERQKDEARARLKRLEELRAGVE